MKEIKKLVIEWSWELITNGIDQDGIEDLQMLDVATIKIDNEIVDVIKWKQNKNMIDKREQRIIANYCKDDIKFYDSIRN